MMLRRYPRHKLGSVEVAEPDDQDKRIFALKNQLRDLLGQEEFVKFYKTTSMDSDKLEAELAEKVAALNEAISSADHTFVRCGERL